MKKRLLLVDDEPLVLQGLQRLLRPMREEWEMDFAGSGEVALERLRHAAYDVVITDMMMPGMDGAQLLAFVKEQAPKTIRLVLSGHGEQHLVMKCIGLAHQYLAKPCGAETIKTTVARVTDPRLAIRNEHVMALVAQLEHLPSMPAIYSRIVQLLNNPDSTMEDIGAVIADDMAMTAKVLQIVNSSFFGLGRRIAQPAEAAAYLGLDTLKSLVLGSHVFGQYEARLPAGFSPVAAAAHSQQVGAAARAIARCEAARRTVVDEALAAGMLHDVGKLVLASSLPEHFQRLAGTGKSDDPAAESEVFGATHAEVGGYLLGLWGLPPGVVEAIALHHTPMASADREFTALTATHVADSFVTGHRAVDLDYLARLGLADRLPAWRAAVAELAATRGN